MYIYMLGDGKIFLKLGATFFVFLLEQFILIGATIKETLRSFCMRISSCSQKTS